MWLLFAKGCFYYSTQNLGYPICRFHQDWIRNIYNNMSTSSQAIDLCLALRSRGVSAELKKWDGYKTIDIAVTDAKVNIEVNGLHHN